MNAITHVVAIISDFSLNFHHGSCFQPVEGTNIRFNKICKLTRCYLFCYFCCPIFYLALWVSYITPPFDESKTIGPPDNWAQDNWAPRPLGPRTFRPQDNLAHGHLGPKTTWPKLTPPCVLLAVPKCVVALLSRGQNVWRSNCPGPNLGAQLSIYSIWWSHLFLYLLFLAWDF